MIETVTIARAKSMTQLLKRHRPQIVDLKTAKAAYLGWRLDRGYLTYQPLLTAPTSNAKWEHTPVDVYGLALAQGNLSGYENCPWRGACTNDCLGHAGRMKFQTQQHIDKTQFLAEHPDEFCTILYHEILSISKRKTAAFRPNVLADLAWEEFFPQLFEIPVQFFDYTKGLARISRPRPDNYHLTYSANEKTPAGAIDRLIAGGTNVTVVFDTKRGAALPKTYLGHKVIDGDISDARFLDPRGVIVGLRYKGYGEPANSPFIIKTQGGTK